MTTNQLLAVLALMLVSFIAAPAFAGDNGKHNGTDDNTFYKGDNGWNGLSDRSVSQKGLGTAVRSGGNPQGDPPGTPPHGAGQGLNTAPGQMPGFPEEWDDEIP
jgi:hypothetical protein